MHEAVTIDEEARCAVVTLRGELDAHDAPRLKADLGSAILQIIRARYIDERLIQVAGRSRRFQVRAFRGADLEGAVDVRAIAESSFPWSKTARQSMLLTFAQHMLISV